MTVVLDPFAGSGATGDACARLGLSFVGIEACEANAARATERVGLAYSQGRLL